MATRILKALIYNTSAGVYFKGTTGATYSVDTHFDAPEIRPAKITSTSFEITSASGYSATYSAYYEIAIDGVYIGRTAAFNDGNLNAHTQTCGLYLPSDKFLTTATNNNSYITITPKRSNGSTDSTIARFNSNSVVTIKINYELTTVALSTPSNFKASKKSTAPNEEVTLSWDAVTDATGNTFSAYLIYKKGSNGSYGIPTTTEETSCKIIAPEGNKITHYYKIRAIGSAGEDYYSPFTNEIAITTEYTAPSAPSNVKINNNSNLYIGTTNVPNLILSWDRATQGLNNPVLEYAIYKDDNDNPVATTKETLYTISKEKEYTGQYTVLSIGIIGKTKSSKSNSVSINYIGSPSEIVFTNTIPDITGSNITYRWNAVSIENATVSYLVSYTANEETIDLGNIRSSTSYTFDITKISKGNSFTVTVTAIAAASGGGTTSASITSEKTIRADNFTIKSGDSFWKSNYDKDSELKPGKYSYAYLSNNLEWYPATVKKDSDDTTISGEVFTYTLYQRINNGNWNLVYRGKNTTLRVDISSINEGSTIDYYVRITDEYNSTLNSSEITTTRLTKPSLSLLKINSITKDTINSSFNWGFNNWTGDTLTYKIYLIYDNKAKEYASGTFNTSSLSSLSNSLTIGLAGGSDSEADPMIRALYDKVINKHYAKPAGLLRVDLYSSTYPACKSSSTINFNFNFITKITSNPGFIIVKPKDYYNPNDEIKYKISTAAGWIDAAGGTSGAEIVYSISGNNKTSTIEFDPTKEYNYIDTAPNAIKDISLTYTLTATVVYADDDSQRVSVSKAIQIARWTPDTIELINVVKDGKNVSGRVVLPNTLCSSITLQNLSNIELKILNLNNYPLRDSIKIEEPYKSKNIDFDFTTDNDQFYIKAQAIFTNTSDKTITVNSTSILVRTVEVPFAIRKGGIGVNVKKDFDIERDAGGSALSITAKTGANAAPVERVIMNSSSTSNEIVNYETDTEKILGGILRSGSGISIKGVRTIYINSVNPINFFNNNGTSKALLNSIPLENVSGKLNIICLDNDSMIDISRNCTLYVTEDTTNNRINIYALMYDIPQRNTWLFTIYSYNLN